MPDVRRRCGESPIQAHSTIRRPFGFARTPSIDLDATQWPFVSSRLLGIALDVGATLSGSGDVRRCRVERRRRARARRDPQPGDPGVLVDFVRVTSASTLRACAAQRMKAVRATRETGIGPDTVEPLSGKSRSSRPLRMENVGERHSSLPRVAQWWSKSSAWLERHSSVHGSTHPSPARGLNLSRSCRWL